MQLLMMGKNNEYCSDAGSVVVSHSFSGMRYDQY